jgi:hypothetical protein
VVRSFSTLPNHLRRRYLSLGIVAGFAAEMALISADGSDCRF